jgi:hypothetical protein
MFIYFVLKIFQGLILSQKFRILHSDFEFIKQEAVEYDLIPCPSWIRILSTWNEKVPKHAQRIKFYF